MTALIVSYQTLRGDGASLLSLPPKPPYPACALSEDFLALTSLIEEVFATLAARLERGLVLHMLYSYICDHFSEYAINLNTNGGLLGRATSKSP